MVAWLARPDAGFASYIVASVASAISSISGVPLQAVKDDPRKIVVMLTILNIVAVYLFSAVFSVTAQVAGNKEGYRNKGAWDFMTVRHENLHGVRGLEPRLYKRSIPPGLPHRIISAHEALMDVFPGP